MSADPARGGSAVVDRPRHRASAPPADGTAPPPAGPRASVALGGALVLALAASVALWPPAVGQAPPTPPVVGASLPVWALESGSLTAAARGRTLSWVSPSLYEVAEDGGVVLRAQPGGASPAPGLERIRRGGVPLLPTVTNTRDGSWDPALVQRVLHDPALRDRHVASLLSLAREEDLAGIDVDYEELTAADRDAFSAFLLQLGEGLRADGRVLAVDVFAKDSDAGYDQRNLAQDYAAIGRAADQVRVMAYDWHWQTSRPGPVAPLDWVRRVLAYAVSQVPAHEVVLGVPTYGYDWVGQQAEVASWQQAHTRSLQHDAPVVWDVAAASPSLAYVDGGGVSHVLWFENAWSTAAKLQLARSSGIGGVYLWLVGDEDPTTWPVVDAFHRGAPLDPDGGTLP